MNTDPVLRFLFSMICFIPMYLLSTPLIPAKPTLKGLVIYMAVSFAFDQLCNLARKMGMITFGPIVFLLEILMVFLLIFLIFRVRGKKLLLCAAGHLLCMLLLSALTTALCGLMFGFEWMSEVADSYQYKPVCVSLVALVVLTTGWLVLRWACAMVRGEKWQSPEWLPLARSAVMFAATVIVGLILLRDTAAAGSDERIYRVMLTFLLCGVMMVAVVDGLLQEVRSLQLRRWGETLEEEKRNTEATIRELRMFRHNIINTLYGYRGVMVSGNAGEQAAWYESLAGELARLNNENALAIRQIRSPALGALLVSKLNEAAQADLPMYLYTKGAPVFRGAEEKQICAAAGVLIDNAMEAAMESEAGCVRVQVSEDENGTALAVMNTYPDSLDTQAFLRGGAGSTKAGHEGLGLASVEETVRKTPKTSFFRRLAGRYVECVLVWNR